MLEAISLNIKKKQSIFEAISSQTQPQGDILRYILKAISLKKETKITVQKKSSFFRAIKKKLRNFSPLFPGHFFTN